MSSRGYAVNTDLLPDAMEYKRNSGDVGILPFSQHSTISKTGHTTRETRQVKITLQELKETGLSLEIGPSVVALGKSARGSRGRPEDEFLNEVMSFAKSLGWLRAHFRPAKTAKGWRTAVSGDGVGFPDLILVRDRMVVAELKAGKNKPSKEQKHWLESFRSAGVASYLWYPKDWPEIQAVLR